MQEWSFTAGCHGYHCRPEDVDTGVPLAPGMQEEMRRKDKEVHFVTRQGYAEGNMPV